MSYSSPADADADADADAPPSDPTSRMVAGEWCPLHPRVITRWRLDGLGNGLVFAAPLVVAEMVARNAEWIDGIPLMLVPGVVFALFVVGALLLPPIAYRRWSYRLAPDALEIRRGVVVHRRSVVPYRRVQQIDLSRGPVDRLLGLVSADLTTAAASTDGSVPGLAPDVAERFRQLVLERAGRDDAV